MQQHFVKNLKQACTKLGYFTDNFTNNLKFNCSDRIPEFIFLRPISDGNYIVQKSLNDSFKWLAHKSLS